MRSVEIDIEALRLAEGAGVPFNPIKEIDPIEIEHIEEMSMFTADFIARNGVANVVLLDTSARNLRHPLQAALRQLHPDVKVSFFFINPDGLVDEEMMTLSGLEGSLDEDGSIDLAEAFGNVINAQSDEKWRGAFAINRQCKMSEEIGQTEIIRPRQADNITREIADNYKKIAKLKDLPNTPEKTLIFDLCTHRGLTKKAVEDALQRAFPETEFLTGTISDSTDDRIPGIDHEEDLVALPGETHGSMYCRLAGSLRTLGRTNSAQTDTRLFDDEAMSPSRFSQRRVAMMAIANAGDFN